MGCQEQIKGGCCIVYWVVRVYDKKWFYSKQGTEKDVVGVELQVFLLFWIENVGRWVSQ